MTPTTFVAIGCSKTPDYRFVLPFTCLLWREVVGVEPLPLVIGTTEDLVEDETYLVEGISIPVASVAGYEDATIAQNCRQHAAALKLIKDDDWVMPGDADLWPLKAEFYKEHERSVSQGRDPKLVAYYWNGDHFQGKADVLGRAERGFRSQTIPTCHVAMRSKTWREVYGLTPGEDVSQATKRTLDEWFSRRSPEDPDQGMTRWMSDQQIMTEKLCSQPWFPGGIPPADVPCEKDGVLFVPRRGHPPGDRLDRSIPAMWDHGNLSEYVDAHVFRKPWEEENWKRLLPIIDALLPDHAKWAREYRDEFVRAL